MASPLKGIFPKRKTPGDLQVPEWNLPAAQEFPRQQKQIQDRYEELRKLEQELDCRERLQVVEECGPDCEATPARSAKARFTSPEWCRLWSDFVEAVNSAEAKHQEWETEVSSPTEQRR